MFTEIREIIFSADLAIFDNLVYQVGPNKLFSLFVKDVENIEKLDSCFQNNAFK